MADKESIDVLMAFFDSSDNPVAAEGTSKWNKNDTDMMKEFQEGHFFEVDDFTFGVSLGGSEDSGAAEGGGTSSASGGSRGNSIHTRDGKDGAAAAPNAPRKAGRSSNRFAKYIESGPSGAMDFKPEVQEITITRQVDIASIRFLKSCLTYGKFKRAILVKRKFTGSADFHEAFLRIEFKEPLITGVEWDEGEIIREKLKFVSRGIIAGYRHQNPDGTLGPTRSVTWFPQRQVVGGAR